MIKLTPNAVRQIRESAKQGKMEGLALRLAAVRKPDNSLHYAMGFDDAQLEGDRIYPCEGVDVVVAGASVELLNGTVVDYVELEAGQHRFIFMNPNDPNYLPPAATSSGEDSRESGG